MHYAVMHLSVYTHNFQNLKKSWGYAIYLHIPPTTACSSLSLSHLLVPNDIDQYTMLGSNFKIILKITFAVCTLLKFMFSLYCKNVVKVALITYAALSQWSTTLQIHKIISATQLVIFVFEIRIPHKYSISIKNLHWSTGVIKFKKLSK